MEISKEIKLVLSILALGFLAVSCNQDVNSVAEVMQIPTQMETNQEVKQTATPSILAKLENTLVITETKTPAVNPLRPVSFPESADYQWDLIADGLKRPVDIVFSPMDNDGSFFVVEQNGRIQYIQNGQIARDNVLDIRKLINSSGNEQGLLGLVFHPKFVENNYVYVNYTNKSGNSIISRFTMTAFIPPLIDPQSEKILLVVEQPFSNHNGGQLAFGPDGNLWIGLGDGGSGGDPQNFSQSKQSMLGKMLRLDVDGGDPYAIPEENLFAGGEGLSEIWAIGLRNPWRFSFDKETGGLYIADVGQGLWEEINFIPGDSPPEMFNFGWNRYEGNHTYNSLTTVTNEGLIFPVAEYTRDEGCSVTGGYVYRGTDMPEFNGIYLFGDFCSGNIWGLIQMPDLAWSKKLLFSTNFKITSFGQDQNGEVYLLDMEGSIYKLGKSK